MQFPFTILEKFDSEILASDTGKKGFLLSRLLKSLVGNKRFQQWNENALENEILSFYNQLASRIEQLFLQSDFTLPEQGLEINIPYQNFIHYAFFLSEKSDTTALIDRLSLKAKENVPAIQLLLNPFDWKSYSGYLPPSSDYFYSISISLASSRILSLEQSTIFREKLIKKLMKTNLDIPAELPFNNLHMLWAITSYMQQPLNQQAKIYLNTIFEESIEKNGISLVPKIKYFTLSQPQKPKLVLLAEDIEDHHVINRCYGIPLSHLKKHFYVVIIKTKSDSGSDHLSWADEIKEIDIRSFALNLIVDLVQKLAPEVILYTSVGLKMWGLMLSRIRLAPAQIMLPGHPDFPYSKVIDHIVGGHLLFSRVKNNPKLCLLEKTPGSLFNLKDEPLFPARSESENPGRLRVIVCANVFKLTSDFLKTIRLIKNQLNSPVDWVFLQNLKGYHYRVGKKQIEMQLGTDAISVLPALPTKKYRKLLVSCDLLLGTFPFGGENTTLDGLLAGLPVIAMTGPEPRQRLDYRVLHSVGLDKQMCLSSKDEYIAKAVSLLNDPAKLSQYKEMVSDANVREKITVETESCQYELAETIFSLYKKRTDS